MSLEHVHKRLTPAHIGLCGGLSNFEKVKLDGAELETSQNKTVGDRVVASKELKQGRAVLEEEPFIKQLDAQNQSTHCAFCFSAIKKTKEACRFRQCQWKHAYCSLICQRQHWSAEHKFLCIFPELLDTDKDVLFAFQGYLASRSMGKKTLPGLVSNINSHKTEDIDEYRKKILNSKLKDAFYLTDDVIESMVVILAQIRCNTFAVKHIVTFKNIQVEEREMITLGRSVYLLASKFNHSCDPNALVLFGTNGNGSHLKIQLMRHEVLKKTEINISYGPLVTRLSKDERREKLRNDYFFDCKCSSCQLDYDPLVSIYRCEQCRVARFPLLTRQCKDCGFRPNWTNIKKAEDIAFEMRERAIQNHDMQIFSDVLKIISEIYIPESLPIGEWWDCVASIHAKNEDFHDASLYVKKSISIVQKVFGYISPEVAEEMCKLTGLLQRSYQISECYKTAMATISLFKTLGLDKSREEDYKYLKSAAYLTRYCEDKEFLDD